MDLPESDWKRLRQLKETALDRHCASILRECQALIQGEGGTNHERYLALYRRLHERDEEVAEAFNDLRRSTAVRRLASMRRLGLVKDAELEGFSEETKRSVNALVELSRRPRAR